MSKQLKAMEKSLGALGKALAACWGRAAALEEALNKVDCAYDDVRAYLADLSVQEQAPAAAKSGAPQVPAPGKTKKKVVSSK